MSWAPDSKAGGSWAVVLRHLRRKVLCGECGAGRGSVAGGPNPEEAGHRYDSRGCEVEQGVLRLLLREGVAAQEQNGDGEGSEGREGERAG